MKVYQNLHYFPLGVFFLFPCTFLITYCLAVYWDHVSPLLPYISETGAIAPESCIFTQMLNIGALLLGICAYIRYRQISAFMARYPEQGLPAILNKIAAVLGMLTCIGMDIAANFQESRVSTFHYFGAFICFSAGTLYFCFQTVITSNTVPIACSECMMYMRAALSALSFFFSVGTIFPGIMSTEYFKGNDFKKWNPEDGGYEWHIASVTSEWLLSLTYWIYILTFIPEFRNLKITSPIIELTDNRSRSQEGKELNLQSEIILV